LTDAGARLKPRTRGSGGGGGGVGGGSYLDASVAKAISSLSNFAGGNGQVDATFVAPARLSVLAWGRSQLWRSQVSARESAAPEGSFRI
jgi:hypothetical protein